MKELNYTKGAYKIASINAKIVPGEKVLIVSDYNMESIAKRIAIASECCGAETCIFYMPPRQWDCQAPPDCVAKAMLEVDVIFTPVSVSIAWTKAIIDARKRGARVLLMTAFEDTIFSSSALLDTNFEDCSVVCDNLAEYYGKAAKVHLTTANGTDFSFLIGGKGVNRVTSLVDASGLGSAPNVEINVVPLEGTSNGILIVDGSVPYLGIGVLSQPIKFTVKDGFITDIEQNTQEAKLLASDLESLNDKNVYNIAEFGVGLNPNARLCGIMLEDEGVLGTIHIGIGTSIALGGKTDAPIHYDLIIKDPQIELDGKLIQKGRQLLV